MWQKKAFVPGKDSLKVTCRSFEFEGKVAELNFSFSPEEVSHVGGLSSVTFDGGIGL